MKDDIIGRIYEYFLNKFSPAVASDDGVFFTPKSLVRMIVNIIEPTHGTVLEIIILILIQRIEKLKSMPLRCKMGVTGSAWLFLCHFCEYH